MRSQGGSIAYSENLGLFLVSSKTQTNDAWLYTCMRLLDFVLILSSHIRDQPPPIGSLLSLQHSHLFEVPNDRLIPAQCGPGGRSILHKDLSVFLCPDPNPAAKGDRPDFRGGPLPPKTPEYIVQLFLLLHTTLHRELSPFNLGC